MSSATAEDYPGRSLGLPERGRGSLASWNARLAALVIDWAACSILARAMFGSAVTTGRHWQMFTPLILFFVMRTVMVALTGGSVGQLLCRLAVVRLDAQPVGWLRSAARAAMQCVVLPAVVIGAERRALDDLVLGTVVVARR